MHCLEILIEKNEEAARKWLDRNSKDATIANDDPENGQQPTHNRITLTPILRL